MADKRKRRNAPRQESGFSSLETPEELQSCLERRLEPYQTRDYAGADPQTLREDKAALTRLRRAFDQRRRELRQSRRLTAGEDARLREQTARINEPLGRIQKLLTVAEEGEKEKRFRDLRRHYDRISGGLGAFAEPLYDSPAFLDRRWENRNMLPKTWKTGMQSRVTQAALDLQVLQSFGPEESPALIARYIETMDLAAVLRYRQTLEQVQKAGGKKVKPAASDDRVVGWRTLKVSGTARQMAQLDKQLSLLGLRAQELESGMPQPQRELTRPDFDTFVCVDIETSGSYGAGHGDGPSEITEIGVVRVERGKITDRQSWLCNPKRKIVPTVVELTGITNEMVAKAPPVSEVIRRFAAYAEGYPLVGHNIRGDLPFLQRAAGRVGIALTSPYFDTYFYAKKLSEGQSWEGVGLESLAKEFGIPHPNAHRALSDAEANVGVYFVLMKTGLRPDEGGLTP